MNVVDALKQNGWKAAVPALGFDVAVAGVVKVKRGDRIAECAILRDYPRYSVSEIVLIDGVPTITTNYLGLEVPNGYSSPEAQVEALKKVTYLIDKPELELVAVA